MIELDLGRSRMKTAVISLFLGTALASLVSVGTFGIARGDDRQTPAPLQVMADAVVIDAKCHEVSVDFGALFQYGARYGVGASAILPLGGMRKPFDAALERSARTDVQTLCTAVLAQEQDLAPGVIKTR